MSWFYLALAWIVIEIRARPLPYPLTLLSDSSLQKSKPCIPRYWQRRYTNLNQKEKKQVRYKLLL